MKIECWPAPLALAHLAGPFGPGPFGRPIWPARLALALLAGPFGPGPFGRGPFGRPILALAEVTTENAGPEHF